MKGKKTVRICGMFLALVVMLSTLSGCAQSAAPLASSSPAASVSPSGSGSVVATTAEPKPATITFWHNFGSDKETPYFAGTVLKKLKEKYPWLTVKVVAKGSDRYAETITTSIATHSLPDVARLDSTDVATFANQNVLVALDGMSGFTELKDQVQAAPLSTCIFKGKHYALPLGTDCKAMIVNTKNLAALGLTEPPATMEELIAAAKAKSPGKYAMSVSSAGEYDILPWFWLMGGMLSDGAFTKTTGYLDAAQSVQAAADLKKLHDDKVLTVKEVDSTVDAWAGIKTTEYAVFLEGPWFFSFTTNWKELGLMPIAVPTYHGKSASIVGGHDIVMFGSTKLQDASFEFMKSLLSEEIQVDMGVNMGIIPTLKSATSNSQITNNEVWSVYTKQLGAANCRMPSPQKAAIGDLIKACFTEIFKGNDTPQVILTKYASKIDIELAK